MNTHARPTRAPAPPPVEDAQFADAPEHVEHVATERINHSPPAVRGHTQQANAMPSEGPVQQPALPITPFAKLAGAIAAVMAEIKPVEKSGWNDFHKYNYAKMGDLSIELTPLMGKNGIVVFQNEVDRAMFDEGKVISVRYQFTVVHSSGEIWPERPLITGMSRCRDSKGGFDDKAFNKAHTAARKYFLLSLFQIPTDDEHPDADNDGGQQPQRQQRPHGRRPVPSPDGKVAPHFVTIIDQEPPQDWAKRFKAFIDKAADKAEIDAWYGANEKVFEKLQDKYTTLYDELLDHMNAREDAVAKTAPTNQKADPISTGKQEASDFPGDTKMVTKDAPPADALDVPYKLDRQISEPERDWLIALDEAYAQCQTSEELASEQDSSMMPSHDTSSPRAWAHAVQLTKVHLARVQQ